MNSQSTKVLVVEVIDKTLKSHGEYSVLLIPCEDGESPDKTYTIRMPSCLTADIVNGPTDTRDTKITNSEVPLEHPLLLKVFEITQ